MPARGGVMHTRAGMVSNATAASGRQVHGRRLICPKDVDAIMSRLHSPDHLENTPSISEGSVDDLLQVSSEGSRGLASLCSQHNVHAIIEHPALKKVRDAVYGFDLPLDIAAASKNIDFPPPNFLLPTALDDVFSLLSEEGKRVDYNHRRRKQNQERDLTCTVIQRVKNCQQHRPHSTSAAASKIVRAEACTLDESEGTFCLAEERPQHVFFSDVRATGVSASHAPWNLGAQGRAKAAR
ncbi:hypothetical protein DIPPA_51771 [Diplonema papillatum]|nr:hypothetical protein DIPPA_51771 [Diplonema papillatum]